MKSTKFMTDHLINQKNDMPRTEEQYKEIREKSRGLIIKTALALFAKKGYHGTSIADIAKEAGISKGLAYNYFKSKTELIEAVILQLEIEIGGLFSGVEELTDPYEKMKFFIEGVLCNIRDNEEFWSLYFGLSLQQDVMELSQKMLSGLFNQTFGMLEEIFAEIGAANPKTEARVFAAILDGIGFHYIYNKKDYPLQEVLDELVKKYSPEGLSNIIVK